MVFAFKNRFLRGGMVYTIWAVACTVIVLVGGGVLGGGCTSANEQLKDYSGSMDIGTGPGATLRQLTELQKDVGDQRSSPNLDHGTYVAPSSGAMTPSDTTSQPHSTAVVRGTSQKEDLAKPENTVPPTRSSRPISVNAKSSSPKVEGLSSYAPSNPSSGPPRPTSATSAKEGPAPNFIAQLDDIVKKHAQTSRPDSPSGTFAKDVPVADIKPMTGTKLAEPFPLPSPPKSVPASVNSEPPVKDVQRRASAEKNQPAVPLSSSTAYMGASSSDSQYRIGPEDVLHVSVWGNEELTMDVLVRPDGKISIPLVQDIQAEGFTASELSNKIHQDLLPYIKDPNVSVIVKQINARKYSVIGYVNRPGTYPMRGDVTVLQALSEAGGFTPFASPRKIKLVRNADGKKEIRTFNYYDIIDKGGEGNFILKPGDAIVVP